MTKTVQKVAVLGMLLAAQIVAGRFISISLPIANIGFGFLPTAITGILFGPVWAALVAGAGDILVALMGPYGYFPPMTLSALLTGVLYGLFLYRKKAGTARIALCVLTESILVSILLQTFWLTLLTGKAYVILLPARLIQNLITIPVSIICIRLAAYPVIRLLPKTVSVTMAAPAGAPHRHTHRTGTLFGRGRRS